MNPAPQSMPLTLKDALPLLRCPRTHSALRMQRSALVSEQGAVYPIVDGMVSLIDGSERSYSPQMERGYDSAGRLLYDWWVGNPLIMSLVWGIGVLRTPLTIPSMLDVERGWVIDIPCGTGLYSTPVMRNNQGANFIAIDCSSGMLKKARARYRKQGIENVLLIRADVANLPFVDHAFQGALSLAGFHAFSNPRSAAKEIGRILQAGAPMLTTALCHGVRRISDFTIDRIMVPRNLFGQALSPSEYQACLKCGAIEDLQVEMAGALMIIKARKSAERVVPQDEHRRQRDER